MKTLVASAPKSSVGFKARRLRLSRYLTMRALAAMAGVNPREVDMFEHNLPVPLDVRRRILKALWSKKPGK